MPFRQQVAIELTLIKRFCIRPGHAITRASMACNEASGLRNAPFELKGGQFAGGRQTVSYRSVTSVWSGYPLADAAKPKMEGDLFDGGKTPFLEQLQTIQNGPDWQ
jgi:hypothetical protein